jgi:hypothetical protein
MTIYIDTYRIVLYIYVADNRAQGAEVVLNHCITVMLANVQKIRQSFSKNLKVCTSQGSLIVGLESEVCLIRILEHSCYHHPSHHLWPSTESPSDPLYGVMEVGMGSSPPSTPETIFSSVTEGQPCKSSLFPKAPRIIDGNEEAFWAAGRRKIPWRVGSPWDFYEQLLELGSSTWMVLCDDRSTVRVIESFDSVDELPGHFPHVSDEGNPCFPILEIWHPNFVDIDIIYLYGEEVFAITEFVGPSLNDLLQRPIEFSEPEVAYVISEVSHTKPLSYLSDAVGLGRYTLYLVAEARPSTYICAEYLCFSERRD